MDLSFEPLTPVFSRGRGVVERELPRTSTRRIHKLVLRDRGRGNR